MTEVSKRKKSQVSAYRRKGNLCVECGRFGDCESHECLENYVKSDMRELILDTEEIISTRQIEIQSIDDEPVKTLSEIVEDIDNDPSEDIDHCIQSVAEIQLVDERTETPEKALPELDTRIKTILSYRKRKELCAYCGKNPHEGDCEEDYTETDLRSDQEKLDDPRTVVTPKMKEGTVLEKIETEEANGNFISSHSNPFYQLDKNVDIHTNRSFFMVDITPSIEGQRITFEYINYISRRHKNMILFLIGDPSKVFTFPENRALEGLHNISLLRNMMDQNIVNHLHASKRLFGFPSKYITYCMTRNLECTTFLDDSSGDFDVPCDIVSIKNDENVTLETVKRNVLSWRI